eukprot:1618760-Pyramimonas_sp.AAC.1
MNECRNGRRCAGKLYLPGKESPHIGKAAALQTAPEEMAEARSRAKAKRPHSSSTKAHQKKMALAEVHHKKARQRDDHKGKCKSH